MNKGNKQIISESEDQMENIMININSVNEIVCSVKKFLNGVNTIIIGEISDFILQKEIIEIFKPELILYERLKNLEYDLEKDIIKLKEGEQSDESYDIKCLEEDKIYELAKKLKIRLIGCDLSPCKLNKELTMYRTFMTDKTNLSKKCLREFDEIYKKCIRENEMGKCINSNNSKRQIVILGDNHVKKISRIYNYVKSGYISIWMDDRCHKCGKKIEEDVKNDDQCRNCGSIRKRYVEIEKDIIKNVKL